MIGYQRWADDGGDVIVLLNFGETAFPEYRFGLPRRGLWKVRFNSDSRAYDPSFGNHPSFDTWALDGARDGLPHHGGSAPAPRSSCRSDAETRGGPRAPREGPSVATAARRGDGQHVGPDRPARRARGDAWRSGMDHVIRNLAAAALAACSLALGGCAAGQGAPPPSAAADRRPPDPEQISPAHPYCMFVPKAGQLVACEQFAFGRCVAWGSRCDAPGWLRPAGTETSDPGGAGGAPPR